MVQTAHITVGQRQFLTYVFDLNHQTDNLTDTQRKALAMGIVSGTYLKGSYIQKIYNRYRTQYLEDYLKHINEK